MQNINPSIEKNNSSWKIVGISLLVFSLIVFSACSTKPPKIFRSFWQLNVVEEQRSSDEQLSLFLHVEDEDGIEDIKDMFLVNDNAELTWKLSQTQWETIINQGETWIGSNTLRMADNSGFPRGTYRVILVDTAGEQTETEIFIRPGIPVKPKVDFPQADARDNGTRINIQSTVENVQLWFYDNRDKNIGSAAVSKSSTVDIKDALNATDALEMVDHFRLYYFDTELAIGVISRKYFMQE